MVNARSLMPEQVSQAVKDATGGGANVSLDALGVRSRSTSPSIRSASAGARAGRDHLAGGMRPSRDSGRHAGDDGVGGGGLVGHPHPKYAELLALVARQKLHPARIVTRE